MADLGQAIQSASLEELQSAVAVLPACKRNLLQLAVRQRPFPHMAEWGTILPQEMLVRIFTFLANSPETLLALRCCSKAFCEATRRIPVVIESKVVWGAQERNAHRHLQWMGSPRWTRHVAQLHPPNKRAAKVIRKMFPCIKSLKVDFLLLQEDFGLHPRTIKTLLHGTHTLTTLQLSNCVGGAWCAHVLKTVAKKTPLLERLALHFCDITTECTQLIKKLRLRHLEVLSRRVCKSSRNSGGTAIASQSATLCSLRLQCCETEMITAATLCQSLTHLSLVNPSVSTCDVAMFCAMPSLKCLQLCHNAQLDMPHFGDRFVVDDVSKRFASLCHLKLVATGLHVQPDPQRVCDIAQMAPQITRFQFEGVCCLTATLLDVLRVHWSKLEVLRYDCTLRAHKRRSLLPRNVVASICSMQTLQRLFLPVFAFTRGPVGIEVTSEWRRAVIHQLVNSGISTLGSSGCQTGTFWDVPSMRTSYSGAAQAALKRGETQLLCIMS